jgi:hypothetical protein
VGSEELAAERKNYAGDLASEGAALLAYEDTSVLFSGDSGDIEWFDHLYLQARELEYSGD